MSYSHCLSHALMPSCTDFRFTYIYKISCVLHTRYITEHTIDCTTVWSSSCYTYQSSAVEAWYPLSHDLYFLSWVDLATMKFDHRSSVRTLELILNNKNIYLCVFLCALDYMNFTYIRNSDCCLLQCPLFPDEKLCYIFAYCHLGIIIVFSTTDTTGHICIYSAYTLFFLFLPLSAYPKPRTAFLEEREDDEDRSIEYDDSACISWK